jgi:uncharacterized membrane protein YphA (DoxX/SURF4 family)
MQGGRKAGIYVEIHIRGDLEEVWRRTQDPALHQRWDLRFSEIAYRPRATDLDPQEFDYRTRIGFGVRIDGRGESRGERSADDGSRTSALKFWSDDPKSLIRDGSGYWRYTPSGDGVRFLTWYDYRTRFGRLGQLIDATAFRPIIGWATAWSFDRLRLWIECGIDPRDAMRRSVACAAARLVVAFVFIYEGLVPKLLYHHTTELALLSAAGVSTPHASGLVTAIGIGEILLGAIIALAWRTRWPLVLTIVLMLVALAGVALTAPSALVSAFNPVTLNLAMAALAAIALLVGGDLPSASRCLRAPPAHES